MNKFSCTKLSSTLLLSRCCLQLIKLMNCMNIEVKSCKLHVCKMVYFGLRHTLSIWLVTHFTQPTRKILLYKLYKLFSVYCIRCAVCIIQGVLCVVYKVCSVYCTRCAVCIEPSAEQQN